MFSILPFLSNIISFHLIVSFSFLIKFFSQFHSSLSISLNFLPLSSISFSFFPFHFISFSFQFNFSISFHFIFLFSCFPNAAFYLFFLVIFIFMTILAFSLDSKSIHFSKSYSPRVYLLTLLVLVFLTYHLNFHTKNIRRLSLKI